MRIDWDDRALLRELEKGLKVASENAAKEVAGEMRRLCPVSRFEKAGNKYGNRPGTLRDSIRVEESEFEDGGHLVLIGGKGSWGDAFYMSFVVLGTARIDKNLFPHAALAAKRRAVLAAYARIKV